MGYTLAIGQAKCKVDPEELYSRWDVESVDGSTLGAPPDTTRDVDPTHRNEAWPSYTAWANFAKSVGLWEPFFGDEGAVRSSATWNDHDAILAHHPGIVRLTPEHLAAFEAARTAYTGRVEEVSHGSGAKTWIRTDSPEAAKWHRRRLDWLCWWTRWALDNCAQPAMVNS